MQTEILKDGALRLSAPGCVFLMERLEPGRLLTSMSGRDTDRFGQEPLARVETEFARFGKPVEWFIDAHRLCNAVGPVLERWSQWLLANRSKLARVEVYVDSEPAYLTVAIGRHLSGTDALMRLHREPGAFGCRVVEDARFTEEAVEVRRIVSGRSVVLEAAGASFSFVAEGRTVRSSICGDDRGQFGDGPFEVMERLVGSGPVRWFVDATAAAYIAPLVRTAWSAWLHAHRSRFEHIGFLAGGGGTVPLMIDIARESSRTGDLILRYSDAGAFRRAAGGGV